MSNLMLHCGASLVDRTRILSAATPEPAFRGEKQKKMYYPIPHSLLLTTVEKKMQAVGLSIVEEAHALTPNEQRYFALLHVNDPSITADDHGLVIGIRNAHDGSCNASLAAGGFVFICDNLSFSGEVVLGRRHTKNIERDLPGLVDDGFIALFEERDIQERRIGAYKAFNLTDEMAHDICVRSFIDGVFPSKSIPAVVKAYHNPTHPDFQPRTLWSLFNAYTEVAKPRLVEEQQKDGSVAERIVGANLSTLETRTRRLQTFLDAQAGLNLRPVAESLAEDSEGIEDGVEVAEEAVLN